MDLEKALANKDDYEFLLIEHNSFYKTQLEVINYVKEFIAEKGLIIYGGTAVDYALRLKGSGIYSDTKNVIPDLDFYSPNNIQDAYDLADIFYKKGIKTTRVINGIHVTTMRVDIGDNHFVADLSYCPLELFNKLPTLVYEGMKIIHPWYQMIDYHSSMSYLYNEPPRENVFNRLLKDIKRSSLLLEKYPPYEGCDMMKVDKIPLLKIKQKHIKKYVFNGFLAYSLYYYHYKTHKSESSSILNDASIQESTFDIEMISDIDNRNEAYIIFSGYKVELVHFNIKKQAYELQLDNLKHYKAYYNLQEERLENDEFILSSTKDTLLSIVNLYVEINNVKYKFRVVCYNYLLKYFISLYQLSTDINKKNEYLCYYCSLLNMLPKECEQLTSSIYYISTEYYGSENKSSTYYKMLSYIKKDIGELTVLNYPNSYYCDRMNRHPKIDTSNVEEFNEDGSYIGDYDSSEYSKNNKDKRIHNKKLKKDVK